MPIFRPYYFAGAIVPVLLTGCLHTPVPPLPNALPDSFAQATRQIGQAPVDLHGWWRQFDDPMLIRLVDAALAANPGIDAARQRLYAARMQAGTVDSRYKPQVNLVARGVEELSTTDSFYQVRANGIWDLGLFGVRESAQRQAAGDVQYAEAEWQATRVAIVAETVRLYLDLRHAQRHAALLAEQAALDARLLALTHARHAAMPDTPDPYLSIQVQQAHTRAEQTEPTMAVARAAHGLAALLNLTELAPDVTAAAAWPVLRAGSLAQVPSDLLRSRPDVRSAEANVQQAVGMLGLDKAELYPRIAIGTSWLYSYNITRSRNASSSDIPIPTPFLSLPIFDWGARKDAVAAQSHRVQAAVAAYRQAVVAGVAEVEIALAIYANERVRVDALTIAQQAATEHTRRLEARSRAGLASTWDALTARRDALRTERALATAQANHALAFATLYRALGGAPLPDLPSEHPHTGDGT
ncbi:MAG: TolC family protein [Burkholderiaceae bacterium]|nr:TolC family protein [Burkholderiaceae bacterium]